MSNVGWYKVSNSPQTGEYADVQTAINEASAAGGGLVYVSPGVYDQGATITIPYEQCTLSQPAKPIILLGDGPGRSVITKNPSGTTPGFSENFDLLNIQRSNVFISDLSFDGKGGIPPATNRGIVIGNSSPSQAIHRVVINDCVVTNCRSYALHVIGSTSLCSYNRSHFTVNQVNNLALFLPGNSRHAFHDCVFGFFTGNALLLQNCDGLSLTGCTFESTFGIGPATVPYVLAQNCRSCQFRDCWFEDHVDLPVYPYMYLDNCSSWTIDSTYFVRFKANQPQAIVVDNGDTALPARGILISNPRIHVPNAPVGSNDIGVAGSATECMLIGGYTAGTTSRDATIYSVGGSRIQIFNDTRLRLPEVGAVLPTTNRQIGDLIVEGGILKEWNGSVPWKAVHHDP